MKFPFSSYKLFSDFTLSEYLSFGNPNSTGIVGLDSSGDIVIYDYDTVRQEEKSKMTIKVEGGGKVVNVTTQNFLKNEPSHLITTKAGGHFTSMLYARDGTRIGLEDSTAVPFIVTNPKNLQPLIVLGDSSHVTFFSLKDEKPVEEIEYRLEGTLSSQHTSHFIDLSGDMRPNLALHMCYT